MNDTLELRPITAEEWAAFDRVVDMSFHSLPSAESVDTFRAGFEFDRSLAVFDRGRIVATTAAQSNDLTLPGLTTAPAAAVIAVTVFPTHRRRGLLRQMMTRQLDDVEVRGEPLAILTASESSIYGRFGYGAATEETCHSLAVLHAAFANPVLYDGSIDILPDEDVHEVLPAVHEALRCHQPGAVRRDDHWWRRYFDVPEAERTGEKARFNAVVRDGRDRPEGYAIYTVKRDWPDGARNHTLEISELITTNDEARSALWHFLLSKVDLIQTVTTLCSPVDEPLRWLLADPRHLRSTRRTDLLWVRILDVCAALGARRYMVPGSLRFEVHDRSRSATAGRFELEGTPEGAVCRRTGKDPDLSLQIEDLGAMYLGGVSPSTLARAQRVREETPGSLRLATAMFDSDPAPWCPTRF
jgi:predicted acetyltransferase